MMARPELLNAMLWDESRGRPKARSRKGARGLMQLMPGTAIEMGLTPDQFDDPGMNVDAGVRYFNKMLKRYKGNEWKALIAYNAGPGAMDSWTIPPESLKYAADVLRRAPRQQKPLINRALGAAGSALSGLMGEGTAEAMWPFSSPAPKSEVPLMPSRSFEPGSPRYDPSVMPRPFPPGPGVSAPKGPGSTLEIPSLPRPNPATTPTRPAGVAPAGGFSGWEVEGQTSTAAPPSAQMPKPQFQPGKFADWKVDIPFGTKMSVRAGPLNISRGSAETSAEATRQQKVSAEAQDALKQLKAMRDLFDTKIKPNLDKKKFTSSGQAAIYLDTARARNLGQTIDPDVEQFITMSGPLSMALNAYYSAQSGARGGVALLKEGTNPHAPHPPTSMWSDVAEGNWDLQKQRDQIDAIIKGIELREGQRTPESFGGSPTGPTAAPTIAPLAAPSVLTHPPDAVRLSSGRWYSKSTKQVYDK